MPSFKQAMRIDRTNYEIFFLDYFEGNLAGAQVEELLAFLEAEPDLKAEFDTFEMVSLPGMEEVTFEGKASLKRGEVTPNNYEWYFAAYAEGDLDAGDRSAVEAFAASSPKMQREFSLMQKVRLQPDQSLAFPGKEGLKHRKVIPLYSQMMRYAAAAAVLLFMATLFFFQGPRLQDPQLAVLPEPTKQTPVHQDPQEGPVTTPSVTVPVTPDAEPQIIEPSHPATIQAAVSPAVEPVSASLPRPLLASRLSARGASPVKTSKAESAGMEQRSEFAYWHLANRVDEDEEYPEATETEAISLLQFAYNGLQRNLPDDIKRVEERLASNRPSSLRDLAGAVGSFIGNPLGMESQRDENGRLVQLAVGNSFEITRK
jgi:hypothetical protein